MMSVPHDRCYTESHEWFKTSDGVVTIGITQHAADELTDITFVEMLPAGTTFDAESSLGEVESVKTTSEIFAAINGEVVEINQAVADDPSLVNSDPFEKGWLVRVKSDNLSPLDALMNGETYESKYATS